VHTGIAGAYDGQLGFTEFSAVLHEVEGNEGVSFSTTRDLWRLFKRKLRMAQSIGPPLPRHAEAVPWGVVARHSECLAELSPNASLPLRRTHFDARHAHRPQGC
jgi:hypothetical protein